MKILQIKILMIKVRMASAINAYLYSKIKKSKGGLLYRLYIWSCKYSVSLLKAVSEV